MAALTMDELEVRGAIFVGIQNNFLLFEIPKIGAEWRQFYLRMIDPPSSGSRKRVWWLGHDGKRLAHNTDAGKLHNVLPAIYEWTELAMRERISEGKLSDEYC